MYTADSYLPRLAHLRHLDGPAEGGLGLVPGPLGLAPGQMGYQEPLGSRLRRRRPGLAGGECCMTPSASVVKEASTNAS